MAGLFFATPGTLLQNPLSDPESNNEAILSPALFLPWLPTGLRGAIQQARSRVVSRPRPRASAALGPSEDIVIELILRDAVSLRGVAR